MLTNKQIILLFKNFKMKNNYSFFILILFILFQINVSAQIGIGTSSPEKELHVAGSNSTIRIDGLNSENNSNNNGETESVLFVNSNGDFTLKPQYPLELVSKIGSEVVSPAIELVALSDDATAILNNGSFTTTKNGMISIEYAIVATNIQMPDSSRIEDGAPRILGLILYIDGVKVSRTTKSYINSSIGGGIASGKIRLNGFNMINLAAGSHTYKIEALIYGYDYGIKADFGGSSRSNRLVMIEH